MATTQIYTLSLHDALPILLQHVADVTQDLVGVEGLLEDVEGAGALGRDRKSTRLNSSHVERSYAVFCLKKKKIRRSYTNIDAPHTQPAVVRLYALSPYCTW